VARATTAAYGEARFSSRNTPNPEDPTRATAKFGRQPSKRGPRRLLTEWVGLSRGQLPAQARPPPYDPPRLEIFHRKIRRSEDREIWGSSWALPAPRFFSGRAPPRSSNPQTFCPSELPVKLSCRGSAGAEAFVVDVLFDGWVLAAGGAGLVAAELQGAEGHLQRIVG
jgi:hypothetical protein